MLIKHTHFFFFCKRKQICTKILWSQEKLGHIVQLSSLAVGKIRAFNFLSKNMYKSPQNGNESYTVHTKNI